MRKFIFVRHGSTDWNMDLVDLGYQNMSLNALGKEEAINAGLIIKKYFQRIDIASVVIFSSSLNRAMETAKTISSIMSETSISIIFDDNLNERFFGCSKNDAELSNKESDKSFRQRIETVTTEILERSNECNQVVVSHFEVFKMLQVCLFKEQAKVNYIKKGGVVLFEEVSIANWELKQLNMDFSGEYECYDNII